MRECSAIPFRNAQTLANQGSAGSLQNRRLGQCTTDQAGGSRISETPRCGRVFSYRAGLSGLEHFRATADGGVLALSFVTALLARPWKVGVRFRVPWGNVPRRPASRRRAPKAGRSGGWGKSGARGARRFLAKKKQGPATP